MSDFSRGEALADGVLADRARFDELEQVVGATGFRADTGEAEAAERLAPDDRAGDAAVQVDVAGAQLARRALEV